MERTHSWARIQGRAGLAVEVVLQPTERSFDEAALKEISDRIVAAAEKLGARLRG